MNTEAAAKAVAVLKDIARGRQDNGRAFAAETSRQMARKLLIELGVTWSKRGPHGAA